MIYSFGSWGYSIENTPPAPKHTHTAVDNGTKVSECRECHQRLVFEFPIWVEKDAHTA